MLPEIYKCIRTLKIYLLFKPIETLVMLLLNFYYIMPPSNLNFFFTTILFLFILSCCKIKSIHMWFCEIVHVCTVRSYGFYSYACKVLTNLHTKYNIHSNSCTLFIMPFYQIYFENFNFFFFFSAFFTLYILFWFD